MKLIWSLVAVMVFCAAMLIVVALTPLLSNPVPWMIIALFAFAWLCLAMENYDARNPKKDDNQIDMKG